MEGLRVRLVESYPIYTDIKTDADLDVAIYEPQVPEGWYFLGHLARRMPHSYEYTNQSVVERAPTAVIVQAENAPTALSPVEPELRSNNQWRPLWTDQHSGGKQNIEIYSLAPTRGATYSPMGLFVSIVSSYGEDPTEKPMWDKLVAVNTDLIEAGGVYAEEIWRDQGSGADGKGIWRDISLWGVTGSSGMVSTAAFVAAEGYPDQPPVSTRPAPYLLDNLIQ